MHGGHETITRLSPHECLGLHRVDYDHQSSKHLAICAVEHRFDI